MQLAILGLKGVPAIFLQIGLFCLQLFFKDCVILREINRFDLLGDYMDVFTVEA